MNKTIRAFVPALLLLLPLLAASQATAPPQEQPSVAGLKTIPLNPPDLKRGLPIMQAFSARASVRDWSPKDLSLQDLSDLLWAANGINRPDSGKRTAASAMNAQDVDLYVVTKDGVYLYDAKGPVLNPVAAGDHRTSLFARPGPPPGAKPGEKPGEKPGAPPEKKEGPPPAKPGQGPGGPSTPAPVVLILVSDTGRFGGRGNPDMMTRMAALDAGIVSGNISLFCAGTGLATRPRASMDPQKIKDLLKLKDTQVPMLNHPVGYPAK